MDNLNNTIFVSGSSDIPCEPYNPNGYHNFFFHKEIPEWMEDNSIESRNMLQWHTQRHPLTCGSNRSDEAHKAYQKRFGGDFGQLIAVEDGEIRWRCPVCDYEQK